MKSQLKVARVDQDPLLKGIDQSLYYHHYYPNCFGAFYDCHPYFFYIVMNGVRKGAGRISHLIMVLCMYHTPTRQSALYLCESVAM